MKAVNLLSLKLLLLDFTALARQNGGLLVDDIQNTAEPLLKFGHVVAALFAVDFNFNHLAHVDRGVVEYKPLNLVSTFLVHMISAV